MVDCGHDKVRAECGANTLPGSVQLRGMAPRYVPFIHQFWTSPEVLGIVSELAGVDLIPVFDYDICHVDVQMPPGGKKAVKDTPIKPPMATEEAMQAFQARESGELSKRDSETDLDRTSEKTIVPWHKDSYPFVLVVMLSDAQHMTDGETELMKGDGTTMKVRSPGMVSNLPDFSSCLWMITKGMGRVARFYCKAVKSRTSLCQRAICPSA